MSRQLARISSGLRVNGASDDAAGLSISTRMEAQHRGYSKTINNASEAISLSQTMSGAYQEVTSIMQRMRELVVQSGNETLNDTDRSAIQAELEELKDEIDKIGGQQFNTKDMFGASFNFQLATDNNPEARLNLSTQNLASDRLGHQVLITSIEGVDASTSLSTGQLKITNREGEEIEVRATATSDDQISTAGNDASALAKAAAINSSTHLHGVSARVLSTEVTGQTTQATTLDQDHYIAINGEKISGFDVVDSDVDGVLLDAVNAVSEKTGVVATHNAQGQVVLVAEDGRNIAVEVAGNAVNTGFVNGVFGGKLELQSDDTFTMTMSAEAVNVALGKVTASLSGAAGSTFGIADGARSISGRDGDSGIDADLAANFTLDGVSTAANVTAVDNDEADDFNLKSTGAIVAFDGVNTPRVMTLNHVISGGQTATVSLNIVSGDIDGSTRIVTSNAEDFEDPDEPDERLLLQSRVNGGAWQTEGAFGGLEINLPATDNVADTDEQRLIDARLTQVVTKDQDFELRIIQEDHSGVEFDHFGIVFGEIVVDPVAPDPLVFGENYSASVETISVMSKEEADRSLNVIDQALDELTEMQVNLGALQNRLESTIRNMEQARVNTINAQSRIMDTDLAVETSELAQQQIIQQAGVSMLAQANQQPSIALSLIR